MTKNPIINALAAAAYVALVGLIPTFASRIPEPKDSFLGPIAFISVFTLSAAVMITIFFYQPAMLVMEGQKAAALKLVLKTIGAFAVITIVILGALLAVQL